MTTTITDEQLEALAREAGQAGDAAQVRLCQQALAGASYASPRVTPRHRYPSDVGPSNHRTASSTGGSF